MGQLILHLFGDYITQSDWMAQNKTKDSKAAFVHAAVYSLPFLLLTRSIPAMALIFFTHAAIDRFRLARYVVWAKNFIGPRRKHELISETIERLRNEGTISRDHVFRPGELDIVLTHNKQTCIGNPPWAVCTATGYPPDRPAWMAVWLLIVADNTMHLMINYAAIRWL
jgi:hypothetical protein